MATCYRHPDRETAVACSSCGRAICPDCMTPTPVGMRCPDCAGDRTPVMNMETVRRANEPTLTYGLIAACVLVYVAEMFGGAGVGGGTGRLAQTFALAPVTIEDGRYWTLITYGFLHSGLIHIGFNMYILYYLGTMLEPALGKLRFLAIYVTGLLGGALGALLIEPGPLVVGASGAVFGLMGAAMVEMRSRGMAVLQSPIGILLLLNLGITFVFPGISIGGHLGGLVGGAVAAVLIQQADRRRVATLGLVGCGVVAAALVAASVLRVDALYA